MSAPIGNKFALGNNQGRPPMFGSIELMTDKIQEYFDYQVEQKQPITVSGLAFWLGFNSRQSMYDYKEKKDFTYLIKKALLFIEHNYECRLSGAMPIGAIFVLKNMGWKDKTETGFTDSEGNDISVTNILINSAITESLEIKEDE